MLERMGGLRGLTKENSKLIISDTVFNLNLSLCSGVEEFRRYFDNFSELYYISCYSKDIKQWKYYGYARIYETLEHFASKAGNHPLEILIGKYSEQGMKDITEKSGGYSPKPYQYLVGFSEGTGGRASKDLIDKIKEIYPNKIVELKP